VQAGGGECAVLVQERDDVRDRRERDEVEISPYDGVLGAQERLGQLVGHPGPGELGERVARRSGGDDRAVR
jgi:hypothetical protein